MKTSKNNSELDEILKYLLPVIQSGTKDPSVFERQQELNVRKINQAKQAILSTHISKKEVLETIPEKKEESKYILNMFVKTNPPSNTTRTNLYRMGYNQAIEDFKSKLGLGD